MQSSKPSIPGSTSSSASLLPSSLLPSSARTYGAATSNSSENLPPRTLAKVARDVRDLVKSPPEGVRLVLDGETGMPGSLSEILVSGFLAFFWNQIFFWLSLLLESWNWDWFWIGRYWSFECYWWSCSSFNAPSYFEIVSILNNNIISLYTTKHRLKSKDPNKHPTTPATSNSNSSSPPISPTHRHEDTSWPKFTIPTSTHRREPSASIP